MTDTKELIAVRFILATLEYGGVPPRYCHGCPFRGEKVLDNPGWDKYRCEIGGYIEVADFPECEARDWRLMALEELGRQGDLHWCYEVTS